MIADTDQMVQCPQCRGEGIIPIISPTAPAPEEDECHFCLGLCEVTQSRADWWRKAQRP